MEAVQQAVLVLVHPPRLPSPEPRRSNNPHPGNKRTSSIPTTDSTEFRFGSHSDTSPYSNPTPMGSGSTGGAGYGNKTGEMSGPSDHTHDSGVGRVVMKMGEVVGSKRVEGVGERMRVGRGWSGGDGDGDGAGE